MHNLGQWKSSHINFSPFSHHSECGEKKWKWLGKIHCIIRPTSWSLFSHHNTHLPVTTMPLFASFHIPCLLIFLLISFTSSHCMQFFMSKKKFSSSLSSTIIINTIILHLLHSFLKTTTKKKKKPSWTKFLCSAAFLLFALFLYSSLLSLSSSSLRILSSCHCIIIYMNMNAIKGKCCLLLLFHSVIVFCRYLLFASASSSSQGRKNLKEL